MNVLNGARLGSSGLRQSLRVALPARNWHARFRAQTATPILLAAPVSPRFFTSTPSPQKKASRKGAEPSSRSSKSSKPSKGSSNSSPANEENAAGTDGLPGPDINNVTSFTDVEARFAKLATQYRETLRRSRAEGRFSPEVIGALPVQTGKSPEDRFPLRDLAQVVPRSGRSMSLLATDREHIKPILSAIQASGMFNQQPQRDPDNELELLMKLEIEKPEETVKRLKDVCHAWRERVQGVRAKREKVLAGWLKDKVLLPDVKRDLSGKLEKLTKKELADVDKAETEALAHVQKRV